MYVTCRKKKESIAANVQVIIHVELPCIVDKIIFKILFPPSTKFEYAQNIETMQYPVCKQAITPERG